MKVIELFKDVPLQKKRRKALANSQPKADLLCLFLGTLSPFIINTYYISPRR
jgi:hypothetical protein